MEYLSWQCEKSPVSSEFKPPLETNLNALVLCTILMCLMYSLGTSDPEIQPSKLICCEKKGPKICQHHYHKQDLLKIPPENDGKLFKELQG